MVEVCLHYDGSSALLILVKVHQQSILVDMMQLTFPTGGPLPHERSILLSPEIWSKEGSKELILYPGSGHTPARTPTNVRYTLPFYTKVPTVVV